MKSFFLYIPLLSIISILGVVGLIITKSMDKDQNNKILNSALIGKHFPRTNLKSLEDNKEFNEEESNQDSKNDAWVAVVIILAVTAIAVLWVSNQ